MTLAVPRLSPKGYATLWEVSNSNPGAFYENPAPATLQELMEKASAAKGEDAASLWGGEITLHIDLNGLNEAEQQDDTTDAANAPLVRAALHGISPAEAADHRLWASVNCFALLPYTTKRWNQRSSVNAPCNTKDLQRIRRWVQSHYLGHGTGMKQDNAGARLWWLTEIARRAEEHSRHSAERLLSAIANDVEMYHQILRRPYLASNPRIVASIYDLALAGNEYLLRGRYPNRMLQALNMKAAAVSLGTLSDDALKAAVEEAKPPKEL